MLRYSPPAGHMFYRGIRTLAWYLLPFLLTREGLLLFLPISIYWECILHPKPCGTRANPPPSLLLGSSRTPLLAIELPNWNTRNHTQPSAEPHLPTPERQCPNIAVHQKSVPTD